MFGSKDKRAASTKNAPVSDFGDRAVRYALQGQWLTLALSKFETSFSTRTGSWNLDEATAYGVVHFDVGFEKMIRCELTLTQSHVDDHARVGTASLTSFTFEDPYILLQVQLADPRGRIEKAIQAAFDSAALSNNRFVHIAFRREALDVDAAVAEMKEQGYGGRHPLTEISFKRQTVLPQSPTWSWAWSRDH